MTALPAGAAPQQLADVAAESPAKRVEVIVQMKRDKRMADGKKKAKDLDGRITANAPLINGFAATMPAGKAAKLARRSDVHAVTLNSKVRTAGVNSSRIVPTYPWSSQVPQVWNYSDLNVTGKGVGVAVIDSGVAGDHPDFVAGNGSRVVASVVINPGASTARDTVGHGTHVAGILAGNGNDRSALDVLRGQYIGVAPDASIVSVKVADDAGEATILDVIHGLQFAVDHQAALNLRVVNLSLTSTAASNPATDPLDAAVESAWIKGLVVVTAAGNRGTEPGAVDYAPANDPYAITVGALDDGGTTIWGDETVAPWSSQGTTATGVRKPEVYAAGSRITGPLAGNSAFGSLCPTCIVSGMYIRASGTSMAAPVVSGIVALMLEKNPALTPNQVKGILLANRRSFTGGGAASGILAVRAATQAPYPEANQGLTPNDLVNPSTGDIDYSRSSWSRSSWSSAPDSLSAGWARSSWSCSSCGQAGSGSIDPTRSSWSRSSWSQTQLSPTS
jgi:serine protease AprX